MVYGVRAIASKGLLMIAHKGGGIKAGVVWYDVG
jgi:hypothetical protein